MRVSASTGHGASSLVDCPVSSAPGPASYLRATSIRHNQHSGEGTCPSRSGCLIRSRSTAATGANPCPSGLGGGRDSTHQLDSEMCLRVHHDRAGDDQQVGSGSPPGIESEIRPQAHLDSPGSCGLLDSIERAVRRPTPQRPAIGDAVERHPVRRGLVADSERSIAEIGQRVIRVPAVGLTRQPPLPYEELEVGDEDTERPVVPSVGVPPGRVVIALRAFVVVSAIPVAELERLNDVLLPISSERTSGR